MNRPGQASRDLLELSRERSVRGEPHVLATVVWRRAPSSSRRGARALIDAEGGVTGWLGGACAEPAVVREAGRALADGEPRLLFLGPPEELRDREDHDGLLTIPIACQSEGAMEIFLEPRLPSPRLVAIGRSPAVDVLAAIAHSLGWRAIVVDQGGRAEDHPDADAFRDDLDLEAAGVGAGSWIVVATQGHYDEEAVRLALETRPAYLGLVASRKRGESVIGYLRDRGVPAEELERVRFPVGLDLGSVTPAEIGVAIAGQLVELRASGELGPPVDAPPPEPVEEIDPVCGMTVDPASSPYRAEHGDAVVHFCSAGCRDSFLEDPDRFAPLAEGAPAGGG